MSDPSVFIASSPLQAIYALAIAEELSLRNSEIHWVGRDGFSDLEYMAGLNQRIDVVDFSEFEFGSFRGFLRDGERYLERVQERWERIDLLFTAYETNYAFEALRHRFALPWGRVGIIEDGIANYFPHSMVRRPRQLLKSVANRVVRGHFLSSPRRNLGGNPRVGIVSTVSPEHVHLAPRSRARVVDLGPAVRRVLRFLSVPPPPEYVSADMVLFLPAVLHYGRISESGLIDYLEFVRAHMRQQGLTKLLVKPHPREDLTRLRCALSEWLDGDADLADATPAELFMRDLDNPVWAGSPTTAILNKHLLYPGGRTRYILFPLRGNRHLRTQVDTLVRVIGDKVERVEYAAAS